MEQYNFNEIVDFLKISGWYGEQCFRVKNIAGDRMETIYNKNGVKIDVCRYWTYYEIFGLNIRDFTKLPNYCLFQG